MNTSADVNPQPLALKFRIGGFEFEQIRRQGDVALLSKTKPSHTHSTFEVVIIQVHPAEHIFGRDRPQRESMPPSETWGTCGWSDSSLERAIFRFNWLVAKCRKGHLPPAGSAASASGPSDGVTAAQIKNQLPLL